MRLGLALALTAAAALSAETEHHLRPRYHFTPPQNFMNDPNGLVFLDGEYHLFYQHNPEGDKWGHMSWGHAVSRDLLHWEHLPLALAEENGIMIFSGSAVADPANTSSLCGTAPASCLIAIYTGHTEKKQTQNLAVSLDRGRTWKKYDGNPVIDLSRGDHRDPKVFWYEPTKRWIMVSVLAGARRVRFLSSKDLKHWDTLSDFGPEGSTGGAWECPDLFELPVEGEPGATRWVLDVDLYPGGRVGGSGAQYFVGRFDGQRFVNENPNDLTLWVDYGKDFYASQSFAGIPSSDGRRIWIGWMSNWLYADVEPTPPWRGVQSLPRELALRRTSSGIRLIQSPVREVSSVRATTEPRRIDSRTALPGSADIELEIAQGDWSEAGFRLSNAAGEEVTVGVKAQPLEVFVDRRKSRTTPFHEAYAERHAGAVRWVNGRVTVRVIFDRTTLEVFANGGERVISDRVYPTRALDQIEPLGSGSGLASPIRLWGAHPVTTSQRFSALAPAMGVVGLLVAVGGTVGGVAEPGTWRRTLRPASIRAASSLPPRWWESAPAIARVGPRGKEGHGFPLDRARAAAALDDLRKAGFTAVEVFAPAHGGKSFGGLDTIDRYRVDPALGTMEDFRGLIELAHAHGMAIVAFDNLGYSSVEAVDFLKACDDVKAGSASKEASFYVWSDRAEAPPPGHQAGNTFFMVRPTHLPGGKPGTFYDSTKHEFWAWSERAGKYYWSKWAGVDLAGKDVRLPQYDWGSPAFQEEAEKIVRFWMDTGIDGMIIDAVNWYVDHTWALGRRRMTDVIASYDNSYSQPEGAGGFREDPVAWITEGGWSSVQDYGLGIWWESGSDVIRNAIETGDPRPIERALRDYHDRVVAVGGTLYQYAPKFKDAPRQAFATVVVAAVGDLLGAHYPDDFPLAPETTRLLELKRRHPALQQLSTRRQIPTNADDKYYAFLRTAADRSERILVVMNFQSAQATITLDLSGIATTGLTNLSTSAAIPPRGKITVDLPPFGYTLFRVQ